MTLVALFRGLGTEDRRDAAAGLHRGAAVVDFRSPVALRPIRRVFRTLGEPLVLAVPLVSAEVHPNPRTATAPRAPLRPAGG